MARLALEYRAGSEIMFCARYDRTDERGQRWRINDEVDPTRTYPPGLGRAPTSDEVDTAATLTVIAPIITFGPWSSSKRERS